MDPPLPIQSAPTDLSFSSRSTSYYSICQQITEHLTTKLNKIVFISDLTRSPEIDGYWWCFSDPSYSGWCLWDAPKLSCEHKRASKQGKGTKGSNSHILPLLATLLSLLVANCLCLYVRHGMCKKLQLAISHNSIVNWNTIPELNENITLIITYVR